MEVSASQSATQSQQPDRPRIPSLKERLEALRAKIAPFEAKQAERAAILERVRGGAVVYRPDLLERAFQRTEARLSELRQELGRLEEIWEQLAENKRLLTQTWSLTRNVSRATSQRELVRLYNERRQLLADVSSYELRGHKPPKTLGLKLRGVNERIDVWQRVMTSRFKWSIESCLWLDQPERGEPEAAPLISAAEAAARLQVKLAQPIAPAANVSLLIKPSKKSKL